MSTNDHFRPVAREYALYRPSYPDALFAWLAGLSARTHLAWDCGAGSGQASAGLAGHFERVVATDISAAQLAQAPRLSAVEYRVAAAEASGLESDAVDLVTVAQALHWFDLPRFYAEVRRVLRPDGALAAWSYGVLRLDDPACDATLQTYYHDVVGPYWPAERRHVETGYRDLPFPFDRLAAPPFAMSVEWTLDDLVGYARTWSATARYRDQCGTDPVPALAASLAGAWGAPQSRRRIEWPLTLLVGRLS
ncbi:MAG TPA: class I SAM-dependent methyltransferase [Burkholderiaceae bacterium]|nr:class I SAM-dependent methyltransferase [Burkholderiaceae bacterium]